MLAAGLSFNISEEHPVAHTGVVSLFFFLFMMVYSVSLVVLPKSGATTDSFSLVWGQCRLV